MNTLVLWAESLLHLLRSALVAPKPSLPPSLYTNVIKTGADPWGENGLNGEDFISSSWREEMFITYLCVFFFLAQHRAWHIVGAQVMFNEGREAICGIGKRMAFGVKQT